MAAVCVIAGVAGCGDAGGAVLGDAQPGGDVAQAHSRGGAAQTRARAWWVRSAPYGLYLYSRNLLLVLWNQRSVGDKHRGPPSPAVSIARGPVKGPSHG